MIRVNLHFADLRQALQEQTVGGVVIATPHATHAGLALEAIRAGSHVLIEKPMALAAHEALAVVEEAASRSVHVMVGYTHQFVSVAQRVREALHSGVIGQLRMVAGVFSSSAARFSRALTALPAPPNHSGGSLEVARHHAAHPPRGACDMEHRCRDR